MRLLALSCAVLVASVTQAALATQGKPDSPATLPVEIPLARVTPDAVIPLPLDPVSTVTADGVWTYDRTAGSVVRIDPTSNVPGNTTPAGPDACASIVQAFDSFWIPLCQSGTLLRVEAKPGAKPVSLPFRVPGSDGSLATGVGSVWIVSDPKGVVSRIDPGANEAVAEIYVAGGAAHLAFDKDAVFVTSTSGDLLTRVNAHTNVIEDTVKVGPRPGPVAVGEGAVWVLNRGDGSVTRVDRESGKIVATISTGVTPGEGAIAAGEGGIWVSTAGRPVVRIEPRTNRVTHRFTGTGGGAVVVSHGSIWVNAGPKITWRLDPVLLSSTRP